MMYMDDIYRIADQICRTDLNVLLTGEAGTGKRSLARYIYDNSGSAGHLKMVNCGVLGDEQIEREMFGDEWYRLSPGTWFLDEIDKLKPEFQERVLKRLRSGTKTRIISATSSDLAQKVKDGAFDKDLYSRLSTVNLMLPSLKDMRKDIGPLVERYLDHYNRKWKTDKRCDDEAMKVITEYSWPGNLREMESVIEHMVIFASGKYIGREDIPWVKEKRDDHSRI